VVSHDQTGIPEGGDKHDPSMWWGVATQVRNSVMNSSQIQAHTAYLVGPRGKGIHPPPKHRFTCKLVGRMFPRPSHVLLFVTKLLSKVGPGGGYPPAILGKKEACLQSDHIFPFLFSGLRFFRVLLRRRFASSVLLRRFWDIGNPTIFVPLSFPLFVEVYGYLAFCFVRPGVYFY